MKRILSVILSLAMMSGYSVDQRPQCGSADHCYALLNRIKSFSPKEREEFREKIKVFTLHYVQAMKAGLHATMSQILAQARNGCSQMTLDEKNQFFNDFVRKTEAYIGDSFECWNSHQWALKMQENKLPFEVKEFDCGQELANATQDSNYRYPDTVEAWLARYKAGSSKNERPNNGKSSEISHVLNQLRKTIAKPNLSSDEKKQIISQVRGEFESKKIEFDRLQNNSNDGRAKVEKVLNDITLIKKQGLLNSELMRAEHELLVVARKINDMDVLIKKSHKILHNGLILIEKVSKNKIEFNKLTEIIKKARRINKQINSMIALGKEVEQALNSI
jgi:hypothetical protein